MVSKLVEVSPSNFAWREVPDEPAKPRLSFDQLANRKQECIEIKASGRPCPSDPPPWHKRACRWACGVTTVPERRHTCRGKTLASLDAAGFDDLTLFVDGDADPQCLANQFGFDHDKVVARWPRIGAYGNWLLALSELVIRGLRLPADPDLVAIFQDDIVA